MITYAMIKDGTVVNVVLANVDDPLDPDYTWVDITSMTPQPSINYTYDGTTFTPPAPVLPSLPVAIATNIANFQDSMNVFIESSYSTNTRMNFIGMYINAQANNLTNRMAYIAQLFPWQNAVILYAANYVATVSAMTDAATVIAHTWNFTALTASNPKLTPIAALQIGN